MGDKYCNCKFIKLKLKLITMVLFHFIMLLWIELALNKIPIFFTKYTCSTKIKDQMLFMIYHIYTHTSKKKHHYYKKKKKKKK